jgi:hypothetical protein
MKCSKLKRQASCQIYGKTKFAEFRVEKVEKTGIIASKYS